MEKENIIDKGELNTQFFSEFIKKQSSNRVIPINYRNLHSSIYNTSTTALDSIDSSRVAGWLDNPKNSAVNLRNLSRALYDKSGEYKSLLNYFINMARFKYVIEPNFSSTEKMSKATVKKDLGTISLQLKKMNLGHELKKVIKTCIIEDAFFGYEVEDANNYFLLKLDPDYCRITGVSDGMYIFQFNLAFFDGKSGLVDTYPKEFIEAYKLYQNNTVDAWFQPTFTKSVCFKFNEDNLNIIPPFSVMFEGLIELNDYKKLKKAGAKINNYMLLHQKVPMFENDKKDYQPDNFSIKPETMLYFHEMVGDSLPDEIGAIVSPMDINPIKLENNDNSDKVLEALRDVYNSSGVSSFLFNNDKNSTGGLTYSTRKDELLIIDFYKQVERWLNRKIRFSRDITKKNQWSISLLELTGLSEDKYLEQLTKSGSFGFPVRGRIAAIHGLDYHTLTKTLELENTILDLDMEMIPLASSHTGGLNNAEEVKSSNSNNTTTKSSTAAKAATGNKGGRPTKSTKDLSDSGQTNRDSDSNALKGGEK
ncbi:hypothetical protein [Mammaliicoccus sciuri]|uniref:hypothetical protein n=1 Tax=Mammaliicoccus sciuri TaxID=1296 RepID=UPI002B259624|nr:hypothetical protein [Mammaliicoccus sciuri]WQK75156.1 hypothetical protein P3U33_05350 [Mammaliicoccus sciuri]